MTKKRPDFQAFLDDIVATVPGTKDIHVILDNYCTHTKNEDWPAAHPNVYFHFTPTSASWLNQVEIWFGILGRKTLSGASFSSTEQLEHLLPDTTKLPPLSFGASEMSEGRSLEIQLETCATKH